MILLYMSGLLTQWLEQNQISPVVAIVVIICLFVGLWVIVFAFIKIAQDILKSQKSKPRSRVKPTTRLVRIATRTMANLDHEEYNEDSVYAHPQHNYAVIFDGVSASVPIIDDETGGKTASTKALELVKSEFPIKALDGQEACAKLKMFMLSVSQKLIDLYKEHAGNSKRGIYSTGIVGQIFSFSDIEEGSALFCLAHVGDSRAHFWDKDSGIRVCTIDHNQALLTFPEMEREAVMHQIANGELHTSSSIYSALGSDIEDLQVDIVVLELKAGNRILLTTDGLHENLYLPQLEDLMLYSDDIEIVADQMMLAAKLHSEQGGKKDDISFVIIELVETNVSATVTEKESAATKVFDAFVKTLSTIFSTAWYWIKLSATKGRVMYQSSDDRGKNIILGALAVIVLVSLTTSVLLVRYLTVSDATAEVLGNKGPYGITRSYMTVDELNLRKEQYLSTHGEFVALNRHSAQSVPAGLEKYRKLINDAANSRGVDPTWLMGIAHIESQFEPSKLNESSKASGMFQLMVGTSSSGSLNVSDGDFRAIRGNVDVRKDPRSSALTTAELFKQSMQRWGNPELAAWEHHAGAAPDGVMVKALTLYLDETQSGWKEKFKTVSKAVRSLKISYWDILLRPTPVYAPKTWAHMQTLNTAAHDYSSGYAANVASARRLAMLSSENKSLYDQTYARYDLVLKRFNFTKEEDEKIPYQWWMQYDPKPALAKSCKDVDKVVSSGVWIKVPDNPKKFGFKLDPRDEKGMGWISEALLKEQSEEEQVHNSSHRERHKYAKPEIAGMLMWLSAHYQAAYIKIHSVPTDPLIVTSLARSEWFHDLLGKMGSPTTDALPLHWYGQAADITKNDMDAKEKAVMEFVLSDMRSAGYTSHSPENAAWHVVPNPQRTQFFVDYYQNHKE